MVLGVAQVTQLLLAIPLQVKQVLSHGTHDPEASVVPSLQRQVLLITSITLGSEHVRQ